MLYYLNLGGLKWVSPLELGRSITIDEFYQPLCTPRNLSFYLLATENHFFCCLGFFFPLSFYNLKIVGNALDIVLHIWVIDLGSFFSAKCICERGSNGSEWVWVCRSSSPRPGEICVCGHSNAKTNHCLCFRKGKSVTLHFLFHKICKNNAIILILK